MFSFMKKGDEREKRKKEKDDKKKREKDGLNSDETMRSDDRRRSLKIRRRKEKLPSGIIADYTESLFADMNRDDDSTGHRSGSLPGYASRSDSSEASLNSITQPPLRGVPALPPRPPKRGILKGPRLKVDSYILENQEHSHTVLARNTMQNEVITYQNISVKADDDNFENIYLNTNDRSKALSVASSAESLTDTTNSSFATPPLLSPTEHPPLPVIQSIRLPPPRLLVIQRSIRGDFGFQLRRAVVVDKLSPIWRKEVLFAEPGSLGGCYNETGLLPGDALLEVNGLSVTEKTREQIIDLIKNSGSSVTVKVQPIAELSELSRRCCLQSLKDGLTGGTLKRSASRKFRPTKARSDEELEKERAWLDAEKLWLVHKGGYCAVRMRGASSEGAKVTVQIENGEETLEVHEDDLEKANPSEFDTVEELSELRYLNDTSIIHVLRERFGNNLIHTYAAGELIILNPECPLSIYNEKVASSFLGCSAEDMPPHIYATAQSAFRAMVMTRRDQSIVLLGRSGSGKTHNFRHIVTYLLIAAASANKVITIEKMNALSVVLEAFGNARTGQNLNATRNSALISLDFDQSRQIASASVQILMFEKSRVAERSNGESNFHVFYYLLSGAEGHLSKQLFLDTLPSTENAFITPIFKCEDRQRYLVEFNKLCIALATLSVSEKEANVIWSVLAAIYHLGFAGAVQVGTNKWQFADPSSASRAAKLLGVTMEDLAAALWDNTLSPSTAAASQTLRSTVSGSEALSGFVSGVYTELVNVVNALINRCLSSNTHTTTSIVLLDTPGFQTSSSFGSFHDLCNNYVQERLHLLRQNTTILTPLDRYNREKVDIDCDELYSENVSRSQLVNLLDKPPPSGLLKTSQTDLRDVDRRGLLWLCDEETVYPNSSDDTLLQHILQQYGTKEFSPYLKKSSSYQLCIEHLQGTSPIVYNVRGWLKACRETYTVRAASVLLQQSTKSDLSELFVVGQGGGGIFSPEGASQSLRRVSSIRRTCSAAAKRKSLGLQVKHTIDSVIESLRRTRARFVLCMSPQQWTGLGDSAPPCSSVNLINIPLLRSQINGMEVLAAVRLPKQGFPDHVPHTEFLRRFKPLLGGEIRPSEGNNRTASASSNSLTPATADDEIRLVEQILFKADVDESSYRLGLSEVFFRMGIIPQLEAQRDEKLSGIMTSLQCYCRGYLARKKFAKLKVQDTAVRCIQRNVRKLMVVREWSWWRLYVKIAPLLNIHRTEEELANRVHELESLKAKLEKVENENQELRLHKNKLETKLPDINKRLNSLRNGTPPTIGLS